MRDYVKFFIGALLILQFFTFGTAHAQESQAGLSISPALIEETLGPGKEADYSITVKNLNNFEQKYFVSTKDIVDVEDGGTPVFADGSEEKTGMELASWMSLGVTEITLGAGMSERINFKLKVPEDATPGSHFGSVFISVDPPEMQSSGAAVGYKVANIVSIRVAGDATVAANIRQFSTNRFFHTAKEVDYSVRIENTGNVLVRPVGPVEIYNMLGKKVDSIVFNETRNAVFPGKVRTYNFTWQGEGTGFGRYEAVISPVYGEDGSKKTMSSTASFWILPLNIIGPALGGLAFVLLITFIFVRMYIKRTLAHLSHGQTRIVRKKKNKGMSALLLLSVVMFIVTALFMIVLIMVFA